MKEIDIVFSRYLCLPFFFICALWCFLFLSCFLHCWNSVSLLSCQQDPSNLQGKVQKHQAFEAELSANQSRIDALQKSGQELLDGKHYASTEVSGHMEEVSSQWKKLLEATELKGIVWRKSEHKDLIWAVHSDKVHEEWQGFCVCLCTHTKEQTNCWIPTEKTVQQLEFYLFFSKPHRNKSHSVILPWEKNNSKQLLLHFCSWWVNVNIWPQL